MERQYRKNNIYKNCKWLKDRRGRKAIHSEPLGRVLREETLLIQT
jgi:hypothetical protein